MSFGYRKNISISNTKLTKEDSDWLLVFYSVQVHKIFKEWYLEHSRCITLLIVLM